MVVFFDLDGTIIDDETQIIPASAIRAVEQLGKNGHLAVVNTGRPYAHIDPRIREMAFGGWVCGCGMEIMVDGKWLARRMPGEEVCAEVVELVRRCGMQVVYEAQTGAIYCDGEFSTHPRLVEEAERMAKKGFLVGDISQLEKPVFMKFVTFDATNCRREEFMREASRWFDIIERADTMLELIVKGCSKAGGMLELLDAIGAPREDTLAMGDSANDLPMFSVARYGVCLGGGVKELKEAADYVTATVMEDGVEKALRHYGLV